MTVTAQIPGEIVCWESNLELLDTDRDWLPAVIDADTGWEVTLSQLVASFQATWETRRLGRIRITIEAVR